MQQHAQPSQSATQQSQAAHSSPSSTALTPFEHSRPRCEQQETPNMTNDPPKLPRKQESDHPCSNAHQKTNALPQQQTHQNTHHTAATPHITTKKQDNQSIGSTPAFPALNRNMQQHAQPSQSATQQSQAAHSSPHQQHSLVSNIHVRVAPNKKLQT
jgi:hypothetical protein